MSKAKTKIAIACQGGGSQTAFTAGALQALFEAGIRDEFEICAISGTSGGAIAAATIWYSLVRGDDPVAARLLELWSDNTARTWYERWYNDTIVESLRLVNAGAVPSYAVDPSSPLSQAATYVAGIGQRREFVDLEYLLRRHIDFDEVAGWGPRGAAPVLLLGAANVRSGRLVKFNSAKTVIRVEHILASCAVPTLFPAVEVDGDPYWDGLFSDNPPLDDFIKPSAVGTGNVPDEIWVIKINPTRNDRVPTGSDDIIDRRNQLEGNLSVKQNLKYLELLNDQLLAGAFTPEFLKRLDVRRPIRIPRAFEEEAEKPYHIPFIEMSASLQETLDYEGKIDRSETAISTLIEDGRRQAIAFLEARRN